MERKMPNHTRIALLAGALTAAFVLGPPTARTAFAQTDAAQTAVATTEADSLKSAEELETIVARIALYPDDLIAAVMAASLYPLQIVQAQRFIDKSKNDKNLKPDASWDGSVISLLNYPDIVTMMNDDLGWTEELGEAVTNQQKDVLVAIQQLRDKAVAAGAIKSNDQVTIEVKNENVVITPKSEEVTYIPQYNPEELLEPTYAPTQPIYYGDPYPSYYYPYAPYWPGFVTGVFWGAMIDWDNWGSWGGDVDIDIGDINIDRGDINFDRDRINHNKDKFNFDRNKIAEGVKNRDNNRLDRKPDTGIKKTRDANRPGAGGAGTRDVRRDVQQGLAKRDGSPGIAGKGPGDRPGGDGKLGQGGAGQQRPGGGDGKLGQGGAGQKKGPGKAAQGQRPSGKPAARPDNRPRQPSGLGEYGGGQRAQMASGRGRQSHAGGGGGQRFKGGGGRGGGGRGGGRRR
jgi:hypothetical protein